jgi:hypothetical protein
LFVHKNYRVNQKEGVQVNFPTYLLLLERP